VKDGRGIRLGKIDEADPQSPGIVHTPNSKFNSAVGATEDFAWAFRLCLSAFLSPLDREIEFRLSTRPYTPLYPACRLCHLCCQRDFRENPINHHRDAFTFIFLPPFSAATPTDLAKRVRCQFAMCLFTTHTDFHVCPLRFFPS